MKSTGPGNSADQLIMKLKRRMVVGSYNCAIETLILIRQIVSIGRWEDFKTLLQLIKDIGSRLANAQPAELSVGNMVRKVLHLFKEEYLEFIGHSEETRIKMNQPTGIFQILSSGEEEQIDYTKGSPHLLKPIFIQSIKELMDELETIYINISNQSIDHIHSNEIILTAGKSKTVIDFLKAAHRKQRKFQVIVVEMAPLYSGHEMAIQLSQAGIETTLITDAAIYAVMSRVNKVILGTHAILANGGLIAMSGSQMIAAAAKHHHIPVVVCSGLYKLSPLHPYDKEVFNLCVEPNPIMPYDDYSMDKTLVVNPFFDYISPDLISLFVTNLGGHPPSYVYRLLSENYDAADYHLEQISNYSFSKSDDVLSDSFRKSFQTTPNPSPVSDRPLFT